MRSIGRSCHDGERSYFYKRICCWAKISFFHLIILMYTVCTTYAHTHFQVNALFFSAHLLFFLVSFFAVALRDFKWEKHVTRYQGGSTIAKPLSRITNFLSKSSWIIAHSFIIISFHFHNFITHQRKRERAISFHQSRFQMVE